MDGVGKSGLVMHIKTIKYYNSRKTNPKHDFPGMSWGPDKQRFIDELAGWRCRRTTSLDDPKITLLIRLNPVSLEWELFPFTGTFTIYCGWVGDLTSTFVGGIVVSEKIK
jgi:hypothetical protein